MILKRGLKVSAIILFCLAVINAHGIHETNISIYRGKDHKGVELSSNRIELSALLNWQQLCVIIEESRNVIIKNIEDIEKYKVDVFSWFNKSILLEVDGKRVELIDFALPSVEKDELLFGKGMELYGYANVADTASVIVFSSKLFPNEHEQKTRIYYYKNGGMPIIEKVIKDSEKLFLDIKMNAVKSKQNEINKNENLKNDKEQSFLDKVTKKLLSNSEKSLYMILILVFLLGMLHTMEAGHSKLIISSYMLNHHVTIKDGFVYTTIFTLTHIADIILLGIILLVVDSFVDIYAKMDQLQKFSIYALVFIAGWLFIKNIGTYLRLKIVGHTHSHNHHSHNHHNHNHHEHNHHEHNHHEHNHHEHNHHEHNHHEHNHHEHNHHDHDHHDHDLADLELSEAELEHARAHGMTPDKTLKEQIMLGFVTGLAPCLMGWSVFMMVLTTKNLWTLFPVILSFGLGIFIALSIFVVIIAKTRHLVLGRFKIFQELSPVISSLLILSLAIWLLVH